MTTLLIVIVVLLIANIGLLDMIQEFKEKYRDLST